MNKIIKILLISVIAFIASWVIYLSFLGADFSKQAEKFQKLLNQKEEELNKYNQSLEVILKRGDDLWGNEYVNNHKFITLCFDKNNAIYYWNDNKIALDKQQVKDKKRGESVLKLGNGIYYLQKNSFHENTVITGFKIQFNYYYNNEYLKEELAPPFKLNHEVEINFEKGKGYPILDSKGEPLMYLNPKNIKRASTTGEMLLFFSFFIGVILLFYSMSLFIRQKIEVKLLQLTLFPLIMIGFEWFRVKFKILSFFEDLKLFAPDLFASSEWLSSLGTTIFSVSFLSLTIFHIGKVISEEKFNSKLTGFLFTVIFGTTPLLAFFINRITEDLVLNSTISYDFHNIFSISIYSLIAMSIVATLFFVYTYFLFQLLNVLRKVLELNTFSVILFLIGISYVLIEWFLLSKSLSLGLWPLITNAFILFTLIQPKKTVGFFLITLSFSLFSLFIFTNLSAENEKQKRKLFADQLISDRDLNLELDFAYLEESLKKNKAIKEALTTDKIINTTKFQNLIDKCCLNELNNKYDIQVYIYDNRGNELQDYSTGQSLEKDYFDQIIANSEVSEVNSHLFHVVNYFERLSYVGNIELFHGSEYFNIYLTFRSKKIPEEVGIPRLLMNSAAFIQGDLEKYSIARYVENKLMMRFGNYNFPTSKNIFLEKFEKENGFTNSDGNSFYIRRGDYGQLLAIIKPTKTFFEYLTHFSYLFILFSAIVIAVLLSNGKYIERLGNFSLSFKIRSVLISLVVFSFVIFGIVAGIFVEKQYGKFTHENLSEKLSSIHIEVKQKLGDKATIEDQVLETYLQYILKKFSNVFVTDINLYNNEGMLLASSQPNLYEKAIRGKNMNPVAFKKLNRNKKSEYIHTEKIGALSYYAAYIPFINNENKQLGILNLQHFSKQREYENQISGFLVTIINIAVLLLIITLIVALSVSNWITKPLKLLQESFRTIDFGKSNKPIDYPNKDEIGALVDDYNKKLIDLEYKAMQLARSERETAWREMAKQVAHEIKNPLTPMRLRLQQFERVFNSNDPNASEKIRKLSNSLIEQIDGLTKIANEFSSFAKLPRANEQEVDIISIVKSCIDIFKNDNVEIELKTNLDSAFVYADKDLMIRVSNNLLKNAIQAVPEDRKPMITIKISEKSDKVLIHFKDNGVGIKESEQSKIFVPNFTTKSTGAGLGLAMVKQIIQNHNGEIWFENNDDIGVTFIIQLDLTRKLSKNST